MIVAESSAVRKVIQDYMDCWISKDLELFRSLFHADFQMIGKRGSEFVWSGIEPMLTKIESFSATWEKHSASISHIQIAGPIATVELEEFGFLDLEVRATSFFQLIKMDDGWIIASKVFHYHDE